MWAGAVYRYRHRPPHCAGKQRGIGYRCRCFGRRLAQCPIGRAVGYAISCSVARLHREHSIRQCAPEQRTLLRADQRIAGFNIRSLDISLPAIPRRSPTAPL